MTLAPEAGTLQVPAFAQGDADALALNEHFDSKDLKLPQLKICQSMTYQRKRGHKLFIEGLEEGQFFNDVSREIYGDTLAVILLKRWTTFINQKPLKEGGGIICRSSKGEGTCPFPCPKADWGADGKKPVCTKFSNYLFYLPEFGQTIWFSAKITALKPMARYNSLLRISPVLVATPDFAKIQTLRTAVENGAEGDYYVPDPSGVQGFVQDEALYRKLKKAVEGYKDAVIDTSRAEAPDDEPAGRQPGEDDPDDLPL